MGAQHAEAARTQRVGLSSCRGETSRPLLPWRWGRAHTLPRWQLAALAPATLCHAMGPPLAPILAVIELHLHAMPHTPPLWGRLGGRSRCWAGGCLGHRVAREPRREPGG